MASETGGAEPGPHFRAFLTSRAVNRFINASKEAMHLPVVQKLVAVAACESFTTRNRSTSCVSILRSLAADQRRLVTLLNYYRTHIPDDVSAYNFARR